MKIISNFVDYYDHVQYVDSANDPNIIYYRKQREADVMVQYQIADTFQKSCKCISNKFFNPDWSITLFIVGFCGELIKGVKIENHITNKFEISYTPSGVLHLSKNINVNPSSEIFDEAKNHVEDFTSKNDDVFQTLGCPIFLIWPNLVGTLTININSILNDIQFYKVKNSRNAFHSIKNFIDNGLVYVKHRSIKPFIKTNREKIYFNLETSAWGGISHDQLPVGY